jgi:hypothetical protein
MPSRPQTGSKLAANAVLHASRAHAAKGINRYLFRILATQFEKFLQQLLMGFHVFRIVGYALHRAYFDTLRPVEMAHAFGAPRGIDDIVLDALRDGLVGALRLADIAVDALFGDFQGQASYSFPSISS